VLMVMIMVEGIIGVAIVSGVALTAGIVGSMLWKGLSRTR
jgi:fission 1 protein